MQAGKWQIFTRNFAKESVEYPFNPIALVGIPIAKELIFCNAIANAQCERNLILRNDDTFCFFSANKHKCTPFY